MDAEIKNAIIERATITNADHGCLSAWLHLDFGGTGQGFGGYALYLPKSFTHHKKGGCHAGIFIWRCLEIGGVSKWEDLPGKTIRVKSDYSKIYEIGHIVKNDWFNPLKEFERIE